MATTERLGRGLSTLLDDSAASVRRAPAAATPVPPPASDEPASELALALIDANPLQPRRDFGAEELAELVESIREQGVLQPILVRPAPGVSGRYQIVAGERRFRASKEAGLTRIPAIVRELDDLAVFEAAIVENVQRSNLNAIEEAQAFRRLSQQWGRSQSDIAKAIGKSRAHVVNTMRLLDAPESVIDMVRTGKLTAGHARAALGAANPEELALEAAHKGLSVRDVERRAQAKPRAGGGRREDHGLEADTRALEADLANALGLVVKIQHRDNGSGDLRIAYATIEQLDDLCRRLSQTP